MPRLLLMPVAVLLATGAVLLGTGEQTVDTPGVDQAQQRQVQVDVVGSSD